LAHAARVAFTEAMSSSFVVAAVAVLGSALFAFVMLRDRKPEALVAGAAEEAVVTH
jgi:hypothetical protein